MGDIGRTVATATDTGKGAARSAGRSAVEVSKGAATVTQDADDWARSQLEAVPPPVLPLTEPWKLSIGAIVARHPKAPKMTGKLLSPLDRFGAIVIGPEDAGFDGDDVEWRRIVQIRTRTAEELVCGAIWDFAIDDLRKMLPPVPGRKWAVTKVLQILLTMTADIEDQVEQAEDEEAPVRVPCEIVYRGILRREKEASAGLFSALALCTMPQVSEALVRAALEQGIPVVDAEPNKSLAPNERVMRMREHRAALSAQARELGADGREP